MALKINGTEYGASSVEVTIGTSTLPEELISGITYKSKQAKQNVYALGNQPVKRARGNKEYEGSLTVLQSFVDRIIASLPPSKALEDVQPFNITVAYNDGEGNYIVDKLEYCEFMETPKGGKTGDAYFEHELQLIIGNIRYDV